MLPKFLACGLAALAFVRATPSQVNIAVSFDTAVTAGPVQAGNYYLVNVGRNETAYAGSRWRNVITKSIPSTPDPLAQWKAEPGAGSNEYKFFNIGLGCGMSNNNGCVYESCHDHDRPSAYVVTPVQGKADTFTPEVLIQSTKITNPNYRGPTRIWTTVQWDPSSYPDNQV
ncbi:hypothetical protein DFH09DRAFT_1453312 [Mycena vulgaris]|nr:hypothetical protein DFH09DRAFT_1453312 [Mycena vulgaris]